VTVHHVDVAHSHSHDFAPGHPVLFWIFIALLSFTFYTGTRAMLTRNDCDSVTNGVKHWRVIPGEWVCGDGGIEFTSR
jgi:hypothetical protein